MTCMMGEGRIRRRKRRRPLPERRVPLLLLLLSAAVFLRAKEGAGPKSSCCAAAEAQSTEEAAAAAAAGIDTGNTGDAGTAADGPASLARGRELLAQDRYDEAAPHFWRAVLLHGEQQQGTAEEAYTVEEAFTLFLRCYAAQDRTADGFAYVAVESYRRGQLDMAQTYVETALEVDPNHGGALELRGLLQASSSGAGGATAAAAGGGGGATDPDSGKTPEELYHDGTQYFSRKQYARAASAFQRSCDLSSRRIGVACTNAVYCRSNVLDWGGGGGMAHYSNGTGFEEDMELVEAITRAEVAAYRTVVEEEATGEDGNGTRVVRWSWRRPTSAHPHMTLAYPVDAMLKRYVAESYAAMDELLARANEGGDENENEGNHNQNVPSLPPDLPYGRNDRRARHVFDNATQTFRLRVAFVASGFNSKAVLYLSHNMFQFFDPDSVEVHVFSLGPPDNAGFIQHTMRGVDWRERVRSNVDVFHDVQHIKNDHVGLARYVHSQDVHVLIEWDGYARQGERAQGLFALRPAPVQILHQEFLGTSGAPYVDYIVTDRVTSPERLEGLYTEKFIYMPWHFFSKGHAMQREVKLPTYEYSPATKPYMLGTGSPQENRCLSREDLGPKDVSFVYCNMNKFLKNNPETMRSWLNILRSAPDSILCLLENPTEGVPYLRNFVNGFGEEKGDADDLNDRIHFLPWQANPFDHQMRAQDFCNVMIDSHPYNGHTTAQDSLYGGVPIVTRADGDDMSSRVSTSANVVLGMADLNAVKGVSEYEEIAIKLGTNPKYYQSKRKKLIDSCLQKNPMHPYWDVPRYVKSFENGLRQAWDQYLSGEPNTHITITESKQTKKGTHEIDIDRLEAARHKAKAEREEKDAAMKDEL